MTESRPLRTLAFVFLALGVAVLAGIALRWGANILAPMAEAVFVWFLLNAMADALRRIPGVGPRIPRSLAVLISAAAAALLAVLAVRSAVGAAAQIGAGGAGGLRRAFEPLNARIAERLDAPEFDLIGQGFDMVGLEALLGIIAAGAFDLITQSGVVAIYVAFLLADQRFFERKLALLSPDPARRAAARALLRGIGDGIRGYLGVLATVSALTGVLSYIVMRLVGLEQAGFWAVVIFCLNFIPTIGSILGTLVPTAAGLIQFPDLGPSLVLLAGIGAVQVVVGNILLPRLSGDRLNISLFATILSLFVWGSLWGVTGMFLAVPMTAALIMTLAAFPTTRPLAVLLSRTGDIDPPQPTPL